jgi:hypothetical protein
MSITMKIIVLIVLGVLLAIYGSCPINKSDAMTSHIDVLLVQLHKPKSI